VHSYEEERGRQIIAVAVTASARDINRAKAQSVGFHANIPKPVNPLELVVELARLTGRYN
jgi:CheY-like chemotaxis protein